MPAASLLLLPLKPLRRLIRSALALLPALLRPPPLAPRLAPLALPLPRFVQRLARFASRPLPFLATPPNHARPPHRPAVHRPAACPLALWQSNRARRQARQACVRRIPLRGESNGVRRQLIQGDAALLPLLWEKVKARGHRQYPSPEGEGRVRGLPLPVDTRQSNRVGASRVGVRVFRSKRHPAAPSPPSRPHRAPNSAKKRPAVPSVLPANAAIHPYHPRAPIPAQMRPAATEEFFRKELIYVSAHTIVRGFGGNDAAASLSKASIKAFVAGSLWWHRFGFLQTRN